jgi:ABC-type multidrug transport system fused ATPase/permease subunit
MLFSVILFDRNSAGLTVAMLVRPAGLFAPTSSFFSSGELSGRLVEDLETIREGIGFRVADFISLLSRIIGSLVFALVTGWKLTLVFLSISPLIVLSFNLLIRVKSNSLR